MLCVPSSFPADKLFQLASECGGVGRGREGLILEPSACMSEMTEILERNSLEMRNEGSWGRVPAVPLPHTPRGVPSADVSHSPRPRPCCSPCPAGTR